MQNQTMPAFYVNHGGGPMPLTMPNEHKGLYESLNAVREAYPNPKAIIMISAHWEEKQFTILDQDNPGLYFDYGGFPPETYKYVYNAKSTKELRSRVVEVAASHGIKLPGKTKRGLDHGVFVPLMIFYPKADIPVIQISLENNMNPQRHYQLGVALSSLRKEGYMVVGSGSSFHNMGAIFGGTGGTTSKGFEQELAKICTKNSTNEQRVKDLLNWKQLKYATECHPREQHLIPLFVVLGAANGQAGTQIPIPMFGMLRLSNYLFQ